MNDTTAAVAATSTDPAAPAAAPVQPRGADRRRGTVASVPIAILALLLASVALVIGVILLHRTDDIAVRLDQARADDLLRDQRSTEREGRLAALEREWRQAQGDGDVSPGAAVVAPADIRRLREQLAMLDIERVLEQAQLQLRLGAAPQVAIDAVTAVDARLSRLASPGALRIQAALHHDLARLRAAPDIDRGAVVARLDPLLTAVDHWHASADAGHMSAQPAGENAANDSSGQGATPRSADSPAAAAGSAVSNAAAPAVTASASAGAQSAAAAPQPGVQPAAPSAAQSAAHAAAQPAAQAAAPTPAARVRAWLAREFGEFMRIREVDTPDALLLAPAQRQLLRDRFRLGVLDLRQAILARDERAVHAEAGALDALLEHYFDPNQPEVAAARAQLKAAAASVEPAAALTLDETLAAVHAARAAADGGVARQ